MDMTNAEYNQYVASVRPKTKSIVNCLWAFLTGGAICSIGQGLTTLYKYFGHTEESALTATPVTLIFLGAFLTALGVYDNIAKYAGAGSLIPITGFSNAMVSPAMEFKSEGLVMGVSAKMFTIAGPVLVFGTFAAVIYGLILAWTG